MALTGNFFSLKNVAPAGQHEVTHHDDGLEYTFKPKTVHSMLLSESGTAITRTKAKKNAVCFLNNNLTRITATNKQNKIQQSCL